MSESAQIQDPLPMSPCQARGHQTALHRAAVVGNNDAVAALVQGGCAVDLQDRDGNTALHEVSWHGFYQCVKTLVKAGANVHIRNKAGNTALHLACQNAHDQTARLLLLGGSTPDTRNNVGDTCLHVAARYNNLSVAKILLSALCSATEKNKVGDTALHVAATLNHKKTVQLLLEAGTDGNAQNNAGKTALDKARDNNNKEVSLLLARAPQVHRFMRGRTIRKRRERLIAERQSQSVTKVDILPKKESDSLVDDAHGSEPAVNAAPVLKMGVHHQRRHHKTTTTTLSPHGLRRNIRIRNTDLNEDYFGRGKVDLLEFHERKKLLPCDGELPSLQNGKAYQLYTLYRDREGNIRQALANGCHCKPVIKKLEGQLQATQEEMRTHILNVQEQVNFRLGRMDRRNRHQIKVMDLLNEERMVAEREDMIQRIDQRVTQGREEVQRSQAEVSHDLKKWCMSQIRDTDHRIPARLEYYKLLSSPSVDQSLANGDLESLPLLSLVPGDSNNSLATYVNVLPIPSAYNVVGTEKEQTPGSKCFEVKVERSPDDYENTARYPLPASCSSGPLVSSADTYWQPPGVKANSAPAAMVDVGRQSSPSNFSVSPSTGSDRESQQSPNQPHGQSYGWLRRRKLQERMLAHRQAAGPGDGTRTLEFFIDRPPEPTFSQERSNLHAVEVTQRFFETVSAQLERWYDRKIQEARRQAEQRAEQDREQLLQRITGLEEELQRLRANDHTGHQQ